MKAGLRLFLPPMLKASAMRVWLGVSSVPALPIELLSKFYIKVISAQILDSTQIWLVAFYYKHIWLLSYRLSLDI
jgi:hypothetical protein